MNWRIFRETFSLVIQDGRHISQALCLKKAMSGVNYSKSVMIAQMVCPKVPSLILVLPERRLDPSSGPTLWLPRPLPGEAANCKCNVRKTTQLVAPEDEAA